MRQQVWKRLGSLIVIFTIWLVAIAIPVQAMPAQVMVIRHAEKYEDRQKIHLNPRGLTRAKALAQFFQSDPRVLDYGLPAIIIAQAPAKKKKSVRCEETVEPLAQALGYKVINRFAYGDVAQLVEWLRSCRECDSRSVLICAQHQDIVPIAKALGVPNIRQAVWPHETYDRVWLIDFSSHDGNVTSFRDIPQRLLFGDSFQEESNPGGIGSIQFSQVYREASNGPGNEKAPAAKWKCRINAEMGGDFSTFGDDTVPILRLGGFTFGYYATTLGKLRQDKNAEVHTDERTGSGSLRYSYRALVDGNEQTYAWVSFFWDKERLKAEFQADVDEAKVTPNLNMPVEFRLGRAEGVITGVTSCYLGFGDKRFHAPAGLPYRGIGITSQEGNDQEYQSTLSEQDGVIVKKRYLPEL